MRVDFQLKNTLTPGLQNIIKRHPQDRERALTLVGFRAIRDVVMVAPTPPLRTGFLRGSGSAFAGSKFVGDSRSLPGATSGTPETAYPGKANEVTVIFNTPYAARLDQGITKSGTNIDYNRERDSKIDKGFISAKFRNKSIVDNWMAIIANVFKERK